MNDSKIIQGLLDGFLKRFGGVIREAGTGRIVRHLLEAPDLTSKLMSLPLNPILGGTSLITDLVGHGFTIHQLAKIQEQLSSVLNISQIAAGASVLNLGVSIAGFAYMGYKLHQIQNALDNVQKSLEVGFNKINERLNNLSGQLAYLYLLVEDSRQEQQRIRKAILELHRTILIKEIAELQAEILDRSRFPNTTARDALKTSSRVRIVFSDLAMQAKPMLDGETMLIADIATQGWAVATATEAYLLLEIGKIDEAQQLLAREIPRFKSIAFQWSDKLITDEREQLATAYRFATPHFQEHISLERVERIACISSRDNSLSQEQIRRKKKEASLEFEMSYSYQFNEKWTYGQIALAEYLDSLSELLARLESIQAFSQTCKSRGVKSSREILPGDTVEPGLYSLSSDAVIS